MHRMRRRPGSDCPLESRIMEAWLRGEPSLEREFFLLHAALCPRCNWRLELEDELRKEMAPHLNRIPEITPTASQARALRHVALEEKRGLESDIRRPFLARWATPLRLSVAALAVVLAGGVVILLTQTDPKEVYRTERASLEHGMSPQGALKDSPSEFRWEHFPGAAFYTFELIDENLELLTQSERSPERRFVLPDEIRARLASGQTYLWTVSAFDENYIQIEERSASFSLQ